MFKEEDEDTQTGKLNQRYIVYQFISMLPIALLKHSKTFVPWMRKCSSGSACAELKSYNIELPGSFYVVYFICTQHKLCCLTTLQGSEQNGCKDYIIPDIFYVCFFLDPGRDILRVIILRGPSKPTRLGSVPLSYLLGGNFTQVCQGTNAGMELVSKPTFAKCNVTNNQASCLLR